MFRKIARPMLAGVFVFDGVDGLIHAEDHAEGTRSALNKLEAIVPKQYSAFLPKDPELVARGLGLVKIVFGSTLSLGKAQRLSAAALALAEIPSLLGRYAFWEADDADDKANRRTGFLTNVGLLGGLLITVSDTQGKPDLVWRTKHAAKVTNKKVQSALPGRSETEKFIDLAQDKASDYADQARSLATVSATKAGDALAASSSKAEDFWENTGKDLVEDATSWASETFQDAQSKASAYVDAAQDFIDDNKDEWLGRFAGNAKALKHKAVKAANQASEQADRAAKAAAEKSGPFAIKAKKTSKKATKKALKARRKALKTLAKKF